MKPYTITAELNLKKIIAESREFAEALDEFADKLEKLEKKYADKFEEPHTESSTPDDPDYDDFVIARHMARHMARHSNNGFPYFMEERTEDDLEESEDKK